jgi:hypothetical protein
MKLKRIINFVALYNHPKTTLSAAADRSGKVKCCRKLIITRNNPFQNWRYSRLQCMDPLLNPINILLADFLKSGTFEPLQSEARKTPLSTSLNQMLWERIESPRQIQEISAHSRPTIPATA